MLERLKKCMLSLHLVRPVFALWPETWQKKIVLKIWTFFGILNSLCYMLQKKCLNLAKFLAGNIILSIFFLYYFSESIWCDHSNCTSRVWISRLWQQPRRPRVAYWNDSNEWPRFGFNRYWRMESACSAQIQFPFGNFTKRRRKYDLPQIQTPGTFMYLHSYYGWNNGGVFLGEPKR